MSGPLYLIFYTNVLWVSVYRNEMSIHFSLEKTELNAWLTEIMRETNYTTVYTQSYVGQNRMQQYLCEIKSECKRILATPFSLSLYIYLSVCIIYFCVSPVSLFFSFNLVVLSGARAYMQLRLFFNTFSTRFGIHTFLECIRTSYNNHLRTENSVQCVCCVFCLKKKIIK